MSRLVPQPLTSVALLVVWLLAFNTISRGVFALGVVLAIGIPLLTRHFWPEYPRTVRYAPLLRLVVVVLWDIMVANVRVATLILGPKRRLRPTFFRVPLDLREPYVITLLASIISLTPGTVTSDVSADGRALLVHGLDVDDERQMVRQIKARYEAPLRRVFE